VYLVDTNVLSVGAPTKAERPDALIRWMDRHSDELYLSVITVAEVEDGIAKARRGGATRKADRLTEWLDAVLHLYSSRIIPLDIGIARVLGRLADRARGAGQMPGLADLAIAATAQSLGYTVLTCNLRHFVALGVAARDPIDMVANPGATMIPS
jgi:predicted nucleic acid-binding protein